MSKIFGYGEDALTLWALKQHASSILKEFQDKTPISDCLIFYRPSFGRHSKANSSVFGEFDAILVSKESIYLIESKWDNLAEFSNSELLLREEQTIRHRIFSWYLTHWSKNYLNNWQTFINEHQNDFKFGNKTIAPADSLLARNLELILSRLQENCRSCPSEDNIKNVLLFFYNAEKSKPPTRTDNTFKLIPIEYNRETKGNFVMLS
ncbi:MAG: hypothetical protein LAN71_17600 [Acidobacteriia bacterium]|nr:hypothetical protein [Terriglobia bacterium]